MAKQVYRGNYRAISQSKETSSKKQRRITLSLKGLRDMTRNFLKQNMKKSINSSTQVSKSKNNAVTTLKINSLVCEEHFKCPICLDFMIKPMVTQCGHTYCFSCADQAMANQGICCMCRQTVNDSSFKIQKSMQAILKNYIYSSSTSEKKLNYAERQKQFEDFQKRRKIPSDISLGDCVDFRIKNKWREGIILEVTDAAVAVRCKNHLDEKIIFQRDSRNIAKFRTFTKEKTQPITNIIPITQNVVNNQNVYPEVFWQFEPVINNLALERWIFEQQDYFPQPDNNLIWGEIY